MVYRLRNPQNGAVFSVASPRRRDRFLRRGFVPAEAPVRSSDEDGVKPQSDLDWVSRTSDVQHVPLVIEAKLSYRDLQAQAKALGIPANQSREDLEQDIAAHEG